MPHERIRGPRGQYKRYLLDATVPLPKTTAWLRRRQQRGLLIPDDNAAQLQGGIEENNLNAAALPDAPPALSEDTPASPDDLSGDLSCVSDNEMPFLSEDDADRMCSASVSSEDDEDEDSDSYSSSDISELVSDGEMHRTGHDLAREDDNEEINAEQLHAVDVEDLHFNFNEDDLDGQQGNHDARARRPLFEGSYLSLDESDVLILSFIVRWGLEEKAIEDLLQLIELHMPTASLGSKYMFLKKFPVDPSMQVRYFCPECSALLPPTVADHGSFVCSCEFECTSAVVRSSRNFFVQLSVSEQIQQIMSNRKIVDKMRKECEESDLVSGKIYKRLRNRGIIGENDLTLQWNTDGVKPFKSSKVTIYPILACINELPPQMRRDNMLLCGLYYGTKKPDIDVITKPFVEELDSLHRTGLNIRIAGQGRANIKVHTLACSVDSVARPMLQGIMQFNGRYGCSFCLRRGRRVQRGRGYARVFIGGNVGLLRTPEQHVQALNRLQRYNATHRRPKVHVLGVKRASVLLSLPVFSIIRSFVPDYMHAALEGVVLTFWKHWCCSEYEDRPWYLTKEKRRLLDERLVAIQPPVEVTRATRSTEEIKLWKASEMKSFLLYYSLPSLKDILPNRYLKHWLLFVYSMTVFLREKITRDKFLKAESAIVKFVEDISLLYPNCHSLYTFNTHLLLHFPKAVEDFGGMWATSTFPYEHFNGVITRLITGTQSVPTQVCRSFLRLRHVSLEGTVTFSRDDSSPKGRQFWQSMLSKYCFSHTSYSYCDGLRLFGAPEVHILSLVQKVAVEHLLDCNVEEIAKSYRRMILRGTVFHSRWYGSLSVRNNSIAQMNDGLCVCIQRIILVKVVNSERILCVALCDELQRSDEELCIDRDLQISSSDIFELCRENDKVVAVLPQNIKHKCVGVPQGNALYVVPLANTIERD